MNVAGIVAEYNPFHNGHALHMERTRQALGEDTAIVCVMSGDFVQRGEPAVYSKYARAEAAARCGADIVFELPLPWSVASAEGFARGAVGLLGGLGFVTHISFGSECGEVEPLEKLAKALLDPVTMLEIKAELENGENFAVARQKVLINKVGEVATILDTPNNILGVEYIKALYDQRLELEVLTIPRYGAGHDELGDGDTPSAAELRARMGAGADVSRHMPELAAAVFSREAERGRGPVLISALEPMLLSRLRMLSDEDFARIPDASEGLENRLAAAAREESSWDGILGAAKSKRYALSRIRRMALCAALGVQNGVSGGTPQYARLLAATEKGRELLRSASGNTHIPVITKPASVKELPRDAQTVYTLGVSAHDLYVLAYGPREERRGGGDWRTGPVMV